MRTRAAVHVAGGGMRRTLALVLIAAIALAACGDDDYYEEVPEVDVVDLSEEQGRARAPSPELIRSLTNPDVADRIIYEPPPNLARISAADSVVGRDDTGAGGDTARRRDGAQPDR